MKLSFCVACASLVVSTMTFAQTPGCDEGVIRLPDRSGTILICSALAMRVPELAEQLEQATEMLESQEDQIAELTRLVRGLNTVSRGIGLERQAEMLQSLSTELAQKRQSEQNEALSQITSRLDELQLSLLDALTNPTITSTLVDALKGSVGDAIAKLDLSGATQQIEDISQRLTAIESGVDSIQSDTTAIRQQLAQMDQQQQMAETGREEHGALTIELLRQISGQIRELDQRGGLINNANTFAEHYHNARILAQRGEIDLALASYRAVLASPVQLADPIIDFTTLLIRRYGRVGASKYLDANLKSSMNAPAFAYAQQLLEGSPSRAVWEMVLNDRETVLSFPPLAALYVRRMEDKETVHQDSYAWKDWVTFFEMIADVQTVIESGDYLSYFADQIRGGVDIEEFEREKKYFDPGEILIRLLPNHVGEEFQYLRRVVDITSSPIGLDFTYYLEGPARDIGGSWFEVPMGKEYMNKPFVRGAERFDILIWDAAIDDGKPIEICVQSGPVETCVDFANPERICKVSMNVEGKNCLRKFADRGTYAATARIHISPKDVFGQPCLSRVRYTDLLGRSIDITASRLNATFRGPGSDHLLAAMEACGYTIQVDNEVRSRQYF